MNMNKNQTTDATPLDEAALDAAAGGGNTTVSQGVLNAAPKPSRSGGDVSGDGVPDVIVGAGSSGAHVK